VCREVNSCASDILEHIEHDTLPHAVQARAGACTGPAPTYALHAGVVINSLDAKGLYTGAFSAEKGAGGHFDDRSVGNMQLIANASKEAPNDALASLAYNTGGLWFHNSNDLDAGFHELGMRPEVSYLLAFSPPEAANGKYHHLKVRLNNPGHNSVQARLGYVAVESRQPEPQPARRIYIRA